MRLLLGDFAGGWPEYDWRWQTGEIMLPNIDVPRWDGSSLDGKTILLTPEQGLGDTIQFIRYAKWLKGQYDCRVIFQCPKGAQAIARLRRRGRRVGRDTQKPAARRLVGAAPAHPQRPLPTPADFPAKVPYISPDEDLVATVAEKLKAYSGLRIGIVWRGSPGHQADQFRSLPLEHIAG